MVQRFSDTEQRPGRPLSFDETGVCTRRNTGARSEKFLLPSVSGGKPDAKPKENGTGAAKDVKEKGGEKK